MPLVDECQYCKRKNVYKVKDTDRICARCKKKIVHKLDKKEEDKQE